MITDRYSETPSTNPSEPDQPLPAGAGDERTAGDHGQNEMTSIDALKLLIKETGELKEYLSYYITAKYDGVKLSLRNTALWIVLIVFGFVTVGSLLVIASWHALNGLAGGIGALAGDRPWVGSLLTGFLGLVGLGLGMFYAVTRRKRNSLERTVQKYEERQGRQQTKSGHNVHDRAADIASGKK